jgi:hypothetical protein
MPRAGRQGAAIFVIRRESLTDAPEGRARDAAAGVNFIRVPSSLLFVL